MDKEGEAVMAEFFAGIDTTIMGRKTAVGWVKMRKAGEIPDAPGQTNYVVSRKWKPGKRDGFEVVRGSLKALVKKLKSRPGKNIYLGGGGELARSFLQADLVDEMFIGIGPVLLGDGIPGFPRAVSAARILRIDRSAKGIRMDRLGCATSECGRRR